MKLLGLLLMLNLKSEAVYYVLRHEGINVTYINLKYFSEASAVLFRYNDTSLAYNFTATCIQDIPVDVRGHIKVFKMVRNVYRPITLPYDMSPKFCPALENPAYTSQRERVYKYTNFRQCPFKANVHYYCVNFILHNSEIPQQFMIPGRFKLDLSMLMGKVTYGSMSWFASIVPDKTHH